MNIVKKRGWVKNAAIIFLAVMLGLTFFSNTIRNRSLPEVAAIYTQNGSITARIRGSGNVTANENFEVKVEQARIVSERPVKVGDEVDIGDTLLVFSSTGVDDSALEQARNDLHAAELALENLLIENSRPGDSTSGLVSAVQNARIAVQNAQSAVQAAQRSVQSAQNNVQSANDVLSEAQRKLNSLPPFSDSALAAAIIENNNAQTANNNAQAAAAAVRETAATRKYELSVAIAQRDALLPGLPGLPEAEAAVVAAQLAFDLVNASLTLAEQTAATAQSNANTTQQTVSAMESNRDAIITAEASVRAAQRGVADAQRGVADAQQNVESAQQGVAIAQQTLTDAQKALSDAHANANIDSSLEAIVVREARKKIDDLKEKIKELEAEDATTEITSLVAGIITKVDISPGDRAEPNTPLITIEVVDRGYSLSMNNVSAEQAARVSIGDQADVDRGWWSWGDEIRATLTAIRNDPTNPVAGRILVFAISGDVKSGDQLNLTLSQRSESFSIVVPNGAIRSDTNGDFVLLVVSRSSPLGNRYIATRADITIIASDDTNTAIAGALSGWDFVITRSSAPVEPGMEVRLVDNP